MPQKHYPSENLYSLRTKVRKKLSETNPGFWSELEVYQSLNEAQLKIAEKSKCLKKEVIVTTVADTREYDLIDNGFSDIIDIDENGINFLTNGTAYNPMEFYTKKRLSKEFPGWQGVTASVPDRYYWMRSSKTIGLEPKPNATNAGAYLFINGYRKPKILQAGTATAGTLTSITLAAGSDTAPYPSAEDDYYNDLYLEIYGGTGAGQKVKITDYVADTRVCTVAFSTKPDNTSIYGMVPEVPEEAHYLMYLYAVADMWEKGGSRTNLSNNYWVKFANLLGVFVGEFIEDDDESLVRDTYR